MGELAGLPYPDGEPDALSAAADRLRGLGRGIAGEVRSVTRASATPSWTGPGAKQFAAAARALVSQLDTGAAALGAAASAVDGLEKVLGDAQRTIKRWAEEIIDAEADLTTANREVASEKLSTPRLGGGVGAPESGPNDPYLARVVAALAVADAKQAKVDRLRARYTPKAKALVDDVAEADRSVAGKVMAAAAAAPAAGSAVPGVPADVRLLSPVLMFTPGEKYLATDPRLNNTPIPDGTSPAEWFGGEGAGAPIFYRVRREGGATVYEYWLYRRYNDLRNAGALPGYSFYTHYDDSEGTAVLVRDGKPVKRGYSQHDGGCSVPFEDAGSRAYAGLGSAALSPYPGSSDKNAGPLNELWGPKPGQRTPSKNIVESADNLVDYDNSGIGPDDVIDRSKARLPDVGANDGRFKPSSKTWTEDCERPPPRE